MLKISIVPILFLIASCGQDSIIHHEPSVVEEIKNILNSTSPCLDNKKMNSGLCTRVSVGFTRRDANVSSLGQRFLVIDLGMRIPAYTRYKSRVLDDIEPDENGEYHSVVRPVSLYQGELNILSHVLDEHYPETSAIELAAISRQMHQTFPNYDVGHGDPVFSTIADLNPKSEFVIAQLFKIPRPELCSAETDVKAFQKLEKYLDTASSSLVKIIRKYQISFVNMSFGHGMNMITELTQKCANKEASKESKRRILKLIQEKFYEPLFALTNVVFIQAAAYLEQSSHESVLDYPSDCTVYPNRIRVGSLEGLPKERVCVDVFLDSWTYDYRVTRDGIGSSSFPAPICTSWAAVFVAAYLNKQKQALLPNSTHFSVQQWLESGFILEGNLK